MTKTNGDEKTFAHHGRYIICLWDETRQRFITTAFRDDDDDEVILIRVGETISHLDGIASVNGDKPKAQRGKVTRLISPFENANQDWLVEIEGVAAPLQCIFNSSSQKP